MKLRTWQPLALAVAAMLALTVFASFGELAFSAAGDEEVRVRARLRESGSIEFTLRTDSGILTPKDRYVSSTGAPTSWLHSSLLTLSNGAEVKIVARRSADGRIEFGVRPEGQREILKPRKRFFPTDAEVGEWLVSTPVTIPAPPAEPESEAEQSDEADQSDQSGESSAGATSPPADPDESDSSDNDGADTNDSGVERISGGHRDGLIVQAGILGDPDAPVLIVEYGDPF